MPLLKNAIKFGIAAAIAIAVIASSISTSAPSPILGTDLFGSGNDGGDNNIDTSRQKTLRIGYFPNINHAQAVIGLGRGDFQKALGDNVEVKTQIFNAGPAPYRGTICESNRCYIHRSKPCNQWVCTVKRRSFKNNLRSC